jgi:hypothetical protein
VQPVPVQPVTVSEVQQAQPGPSRRKKKRVPVESDSSDSDIDLQEVYRAKYRAKYREKYAAKTAPAKPTQDEFKTHVTNYARGAVRKELDEHILAATMKGLFGN